MLTITDKTVLSLPCGDKLAEKIKTDTGLKERDKCLLLLELQGTEEQYDKAHLELNERRTAMLNKKSFWRKLEDLPVIGFNDYSENASSFGMAALIGAGFTVFKYIDYGAALLFAPLAGAVALFAGLGIHIGLSHLVSLKAERSDRLNCSCINTRLLIDSYEYDIKNLRLSPQENKHENGSNSIQAGQDEMRKMVEQIETEKSLSRESKIQLLEGLGLLGCSNYKKIYVPLPDAPI